MVGQHCSNVDLSDWPEKDTPQIWKVSGGTSSELWFVEMMQRQTRFSLQMYHNNVLEFYIVTTDENECNWMMFVHKARYGGGAERRVLRRRSMEE